MYYVLSPGYHGFDEDYSGTTQKTAFTFIQGKYIFITELHVFYIYALVIVNE